jgi:VanZ family protein
MFAKLKAAVPRAAQAAFFTGVVVVVWLSLEPRYTPDRNVWERMDHLPHVLAYGALTLSAAMGFQRGRPVLAVCLGLIVLGTFLEFAQLYVPGRSAGFGDVIANVTGIAFGLAAAKVGERVAGIIA